MAITDPESIGLQQEPMANSPESLQLLTELQEKFHFDMDGHELIDPETTQGSVVSMTEVEPVSTISGEALPSGVKVYDVGVADPFVQADPASYRLVKAHIEKMEQQMIDDGFNPLVGRSEAQSRDERNKYTEAWLHQPELQPLSVWRDNVPTANALSYLTNPWVGAEVNNNKKGEERVEDTITPETAAQLRFVDDAVAIRDRAVVMQDIAETHIGEVHNAGDDIRWLSLASGTAEPSIKAAKAATESDQVNIELTVADLDGKALKFVKANAEANEFSGQVNTVWTNILDENLPQTLADSTGTDEKFDIVENMGFEEYLPQDGDELEAVKGAGLPQASEFTRRAYDMVKPGGMLISGNMVLDRPQLGFVFGIVDWPIINARSEESILRVYKEAGILDDAKAKVEMYRVRNTDTGARLYNIVKVTKLADEQSSQAI